MPSNILYSNQRQGIFKDITESSGLKSEGGSSAVAVGDLIMTVTSTSSLLQLNGGHISFTRISGNGTYEVVKNNKEMFAALEKLKAYDATFFDFDNDGYLDLLIAGESTEKDGRGIFLYHNDGNGNFTDVSQLLPPESEIRQQIAYLIIMMTETSMWL